MALIHIPFEVYALFLKPILQVILHNDQRNEYGKLVQPSRPWAFWHPFVNISMTPSGCSVVCPRKEADEFFRPILDGLNASLRSSASISDDDYSVIMIGGEGLEAGQRVLDLTSPLALARMCVHLSHASMTSRKLTIVPDRSSSSRAIGATSSWYPTTSARPSYMP